MPAQSRPLIALPFNAAITGFLGFKGDLEHAALGPAPSAAENVLAFVVPPSRISLRSATGAERPRRPPSAPRSAHWRSLVSAKESFRKSAFRSAADRALRRSGRFQSQEGEMWPLVLDQEFLRRGALDLGVNCRSSLHRLEKRSGCAPAPAPSKEIQMPESRPIAGLLRLQQERKPPLLTSGIRE